MSDNRKKRLWEKELRDLSQYNWLTAICNSAAHRDCVSDIRVANVIMQHTNPQGIAYPSQQTIAQLSGPTSERQVSKSIRRMNESGALIVRRISSLTNQQREKLGASFRRTNRGKVYEPCMFWALETLEAHGHALQNNTRRPEPEHLRKAREHRTMDVPQYRTLNVRSLPDNGCQANSLGYAHSDTRTGVEWEKNREGHDSETQRQVPTKLKGGGAGALPRMAEIITMPLSVITPEKNETEAQTVEALGGWEEANELSPDDFQSLVAKVANGELPLQEVQLQALSMRMREAANG